MPPASKKKKKPVVNPARGFATTSIASKPKAEKEVVSEPIAVTNKEETSKISISVAAETPAIIVTETERELHELGPDELEQRLEESGLQLIVEKCGAKSQREASRYVAKLQTDCRVLRAQAQGIPLRQMFTSEAVEKALILALEDITDTVSSPEERQSRRVLPEEDAIARLWTLQRALLSLGFSEANAEEALGHVLKLSPSESLIWGLDESLDWLALSLPEEDLPDYDAQTGKVKGLISSGSRKC